MESLDWLDPYSKMKAKVNESLSSAFMKYGKDDPCMSNEDFVNSTTVIVLEQLQARGEIQKFTAQASSKYGRMSIGVILFDFTSRGSMFLYLDEIHAAAVHCS